MTKRKRQKKLDGDVVLSNLVGMIESQIANLPNDYKPAAHIDQLLIQLDTITAQLSEAVHMSDDEAREYLHSVVTILDDKDNHIDDFLSYGDQFLKGEYTQLWNAYESHCDGLEDLI